MALIVSSGYKIVYSGDSSYDQNLVKYGRDADLFITESTFSDQQEQEANLKTHSTFSHAVKMAMEMKAKKVLLSHFSVNEAAY